ncbi:hypothetical protein C1H46_018201 [Malus baccata]|uniref:Uncharacterized protein n=1 Tax=Malus baccata TaxID=106549 RepID=A0A540MC80_MALBA|nr:hypothetical protein C1H46_018201 [Malus baccata]
MVAFTVRRCGTLLHGPILGKGFSRSPKFVAWPAVDDSVCYSAQMKEEASSCKLWSQAMGVLCSSADTLELISNLK